LREQQVLRETLLYRATPEDLAALFRLGDMMNLYLLEYQADGLTMRNAWSPLLRMCGT
jgi:hypothetical protein